MTGLLGMHWSKTRQKTYENCPRQFFYENVAAPLNPALKSIAERRSASLLRHELIRDTIRGVLSAKDPSNVDAEAAVFGVERRIHELIPDKPEANGEMSIIQLCLNNFFEHHLPEICRHRILHVSPGEPAEFIYDRLTMMVVPEVVLDAGDRIRVITWKTGASRYRSISDGRLSVGGLTCWVRSALRETARPVNVSEVYLRESILFDESLSDQDVRSFVAQARGIVESYGRSAKIRDFPARPGLRTCRFCSFQSMCQEWKEFSEASYDIEALSSQLDGGAAARIRDKEMRDARTAVAGEVRRVVARQSG